MSIKMQSYCTRIAARPPLSQPDSRRSAVTITHGLNDEYLLQGCTGIFLKMQRGGLAPSCYLDHQTTNQANPEPCTPTLTCCSHFRGRAQDQSRPPECLGLSECLGGRPLPD